MFKSSQNWWTCSFSLQYQYTLNVWSRGKHLALFSRESNKKTKLTSFPRDHTLNAWLYTDISDPRSQEHYWTSSWSKTWKKFRPVRDLNLSPLHIYDFLYISNHYSPLCYIFRLSLQQSFGKIILLYSARRQQLQNCIPVEIHLNLIRSTWPRINQSQYLFCLGKV